MNQVAVSVVLRSSAFLGPSLLKETKESSFLSCFSHADSRLSLRKEEKKELQLGTDCFSYLKEQLSLGSI